LRGIRTHSTPRTGTPLPLDCVSRAQDAGSPLGKIRYSFFGKFVRNRLQRRVSQDSIASVRVPGTNCSGS
jgi:hypothetical protein